MTDEDITKNDELAEGKKFVKKKQRERYVRKGRMKQERLRGFVRFLLTLVMLAGLYYLSQASGWYMNSNAFNYIDGGSVEVINNKIIPSYKILAVLKSSNVPEVPLYLAKTNDIKKELKKLPPVENVYIRRYAFSISYGTNRSI